MKTLLLGCAVLLALAACASHPPHCGGRLTPINHRPIRPDLDPGARAAAARSRMGVGS